MAASIPRRLRAFPPQGYNLPFSPQSLFAEVQLTPQIVMELVPASYVRNRKPAVSRERWLEWYANANIKPPAWMLSPNYSKVRLIGYEGDDPNVLAAFVEVEFREFQKPHPTGVDELEAIQHRSKLCIQQTAAWWQEAYERSQAEERASLARRAELKKLQKQNSIKRSVLDKLRKLLPSCLGQQCPRQTSSSSTAGSSSSSSSSIPATATIRINGSGGSKAQRQATQMLPSTATVTGSATTDLYDRAIALENSSLNIGTYSASAALSAQQAADSACHQLLLDRLNDVQGELQYLDSLYLVAAAVAHVAAEGGGGGRGGRCGSDNNEDSSTALFDKQAEARLLETIDAWDAGLEEESIDGRAAALCEGHMTLQDSCPGPYFQGDGCYEPASEQHCEASCEESSSSGDYYEGEEYCEESRSHSGCASKPMFVFNDAGKEVEGAEGGGASEGTTGICADGAAAATATSFIGGVVEPALCVSMGDDEDEVPPPVEIADRVDSVMLLSEMARINSVTGPVLLSNARQLPLQGNKST